MDLGLFGNFIERHREYDLDSQMLNELASGVPMLTSIPISFQSEIGFTFSGDRELYQTMQIENLQTRQEINLNFSSGYSEKVAYSGISLKLSIITMFNELLEVEFPNEVLSSRYCFVFVMEGLLVSLSSDLLTQEIINSLYQPGFADIRRRFKTTEHGLTETQKTIERNQIVLDKTMLNNFEVTQKTIERNHSDLDKTMLNNFEGVKNEIEKTRNVNLEGKEKLKLKARFQYCERVKRGDLSYFLVYLTSTEPVKTLTLKNYKTTGEIEVKNFPELENKFTIRLICPALKFSHIERVVKITPGKPIERELIVFSLIPEFCGDFRIDVEFIAEDGTVFFSWHTEEPIHVQEEEKEYAMLGGAKLRVSPKMNAIRTIASFSILVFPGLLSQFGIFSIVPLVMWIIAFIVIAIILLFIWKMRRDGEPIVKLEIPITCPHCKKPVDISDSICPHCHKNIEWSKRKGKENAAHAEGYEKNLDYTVRQVERLSSALDYLKPVHHFDP